jgi:ribose-phosphate pyrophosphokinase
MARAARAAMDRGATAVHAVATHGVFAETAADALGIPEIASIAVVDSIDGVGRRCPELASRLVVLPSAPIVCERIRRLMAAPGL